MTGRMMSSVCSPKRGAGRRIEAGERLNVTGKRVVRNLPSVG